MIIITIIIHLLLFPLMIRLIIVMNKLMPEHMSGVMIMLFQYNKFNHITYHYKYYT